VSMATGLSSMPVLLCASASTDQPRPNESESADKAQSHAPTTRQRQRAGADERRRLCGNTTTHGREGEQSTQSQSAQIEGQRGRVTSAHRLPMEEMERMSIMNSLACTVRTPGPAMQTQFMRMTPGRGGRNWQSLTGDWVGGALDVGAVQLAVAHAQSVPAVASRRTTDIRVRSRHNVARRRTERRATRTRLSWRRRIRT
jgi:hypothetical protein